MGSRRTSRCHGIYSSQRRPGDRDARGRAAKSQTIARARRDRAAFHSAFACVGSQKNLMHLLVGLNGSKPGWLSLGSFHWSPRRPRKNDFVNTFPSKASYNAAESRRLKSLLSFGENRMKKLRA